MRPILVACALVLGACHPSVRFADRPVLWHDPDDRPVPLPARKAGDPLVRWAGARDALLLPAEHAFSFDYQHEARNVNALSIYRFKVEPDVLPGEYRYHLLLVTPRSRREREFNGRLELVVNLADGGQNAMMTFPEPGDASASEFRLAFKYFRRVEGTFRVNPKARVENVQVRVFETGSNQPRAIQTVGL